MRTLPSGFSIDLDQIKAFCEKWKVAEFSLFGSVIREDFRPDSDIDVLIRTAPDSTVDTFDWVDMIEELQTMFGRKVDLVDADGLRNPFRRHHIMNNHEVIYVA
jgi:predicted nucleotidyltransferase